MGKIRNQITLRRSRAILFFGIVGLAVISYFILQSEDVSALDEYNCLSCHESMDITKTNGDGKAVSLRIDKTDVDNAAHKYIDCTTCHTFTPHKTPPELTKVSSAEKCGTCHQYQYKQHLNSIHGQQLIQGNTDVATCIDCHSPKGDAHSVIRVLEYNAPTYKKNTAETCASCHNDEKLMQTYGIVDKVYESYMRSYHGKAISMGTNELTQLDAATCTNCHGVHSIKAIDDPLSTVAGMDNLVQTCETCHVGAGTEFAKGFLGHKESSPTYVPSVHYVDKFFEILLYAVGGFGGFVLIGAIFGYSRNRWRR